MDLGFWDFLTVTGVAAIIGVTVYQVVDRILTYRENMFTQLQDLRHDSLG